MIIQTAHEAERKAYLAMLERIAEYTAGLIEHAQKEDFNDIVVSYSFNPIRKGQMYFGRIVYNYKQMLDPLVKLDRSAQKEV